MLYVMCGCPGSGKTTWCKKNLANAVYVSTDDMFLSMQSAECFSGCKKSAREKKRAFRKFA